MKILTLAILVFVSEFILSYLADMRAVFVVSRKKWKALAYDVGAGSLAWLVLAVAYVTQNPVLIGLAILGSGSGTFLAASRKIKRKKTTRRKTPFSTA